jgi:hypothetical protein
MVASAQGNVEERDVLLCMGASGAMFFALVFLLPPSTSSDSCDYHSKTTFTSDCPATHHKS